jgi:hypothetical protein
VVSEVAASSAASGRAKGRHDEHVWEGGGSGDGGQERDVLLRRGLLVPSFIASWEASSPGSFWSHCDDLETGW